MKNMAWRFVGNLVIVVHNKNAPTDHEASEYMTTLRQQDISRLRTLVFTDGGGPSAAQRKQFNEILSGRELLTAVVSNDPIVRGITTAMSWFNRKIRAFSPDAVESAFTHLNIRNQEVEAVWRHVRELRNELNSNALTKFK